MTKSEGHPDSAKSRWNGIHLSEFLKDREVVVAKTQVGVYVSELVNGVTASHKTHFIRFCDCGSCIRYRLDRGRL